MKGRMVSLAGVIPFNNNFEYLVFTCWRCSWRHFVGAALEEVSFSSAHRIFLTDKWQEVHVPPPRENFLSFFSIEMG